jgi:hypothetical protein
VLFYPNGKKKEGAWLEGNLEYEINNWSLIFIIYYYN